MEPELLSVRNYRMAGVSAETESRLGGWMDAVCRASVSVMHHWRATDVQLNLVKGCVPCEDNLLRSVLAETFSAARLVFTFGPTMPLSLLFHYVMLWLVRSEMTVHLVLLRASVFMVFVKVLKSHSETAQSRPCQKTVGPWNWSVLRFSQPNGNMTSNFVFGVSSCVKSHICWLNQQFR